MVLIRKCPFLGVSTTYLWITFLLLHTSSVIILLIAAIPVSTAVAKGGEAFPVVGLYKKSPNKAKRKNLQVLLHWAHALKPLARKSKNICILTEKTHLCNVPGTGKNFQMFPIKLFCWWFLICVWLPAWQNQKEICMWEIRRQFAVWVEFIFCAVQQHFSAGFGLSAFTEKSGLSWTCMNQAKSVIARSGKECVSFLLILYLPLLTEVIAAAILTPVLNLRRI